MPFLKDEGNHPLGEKIKEWLQSKYDLTELVRKNKHGVKAEALNKALRAKLEIEGAHKETHVLYNVFLIKERRDLTFLFMIKTIILHVSEITLLESVVATTAGNDWTVCTKISK